MQAKKFILTGDTDALVSRIHLALTNSQQPVPQEDVARLVELCEDLALRYAALSRFVAGVPGELHPGRHSVLEYDTDLASAAFLDVASKLRRAKGEYAKQETRWTHFRCQCCTLPTLIKDPSDGSFESCPVCHWEQERITDPAVETGGPTALASPMRAGGLARRNRRKSLTCSE